MHPCLYGRSQMFVFFVVFFSPPRLPADRESKENTSVTFKPMYSIQRYVIVQDHTLLNTLSQSWPVQHFGWMCAVALLVMGIYIMLISVCWFSAGSGPKKVQVPLISADNVCSLDWSLFFFLCIINQYSHNKPLTHTHTNRVCPVPQTIRTI